MIDVHRDMDILTALRHPMGERKEIEQRQCDTPCDVITRIRPVSWMHSLT